MSKKRPAFRGRTVVVKRDHILIACPACGRHDAYARSKTCDFVCKKCGEVFRRDLTA